MKNFDKISRNLLLSASVPAIAMLSAVPAFAGEVTISGPTTPGAVNAEINANPDPDLDLTFEDDAEVTGGGNVFVSPFFAGENSGAISVINEGDIGALDAMGNITSFNRLDLRGSFGNEDNTLTVNNSGLVTGGLFGGNFSNFGGDVSIVNSGNIFNGLNGSSAGNVSIDSSAGTVSSGSINASSISSFDSKTEMGVTTTTVTSGTATVIAGDVVSADGMTRGDVVANSRANDATVTVSGTADSVLALSGSATNSVTESNRAAAGMTVTTFDRVNTSLGTDASITITKTGDVNSVSAQTNNSGSAEAIIDGKVSAGGFISVRGFDGQDSTTVNTVTQNKAGVTTQTTSDSSTTRNGGDSTLTIGATAEVETGTVRVENTGSASAEINGQVKASSVTVSTQFRDNTTSSSVSNFDDDGNFIGSSFENTREAAGGAASLEVGAMGTLESGSIFVGGTEGATVTNNGDGTITGQVTVDSYQQITDSSSSESTRDPDTFGTLTSSNASTRVGAGGAALLDNLAGATIDINGGFNHRIEGLTSATLNNAGDIIGSTIIDAQHSIFSAESENSFEDNSKMGNTDTADSSFRVDRSVGGTAELNNAAGATLDGGFIQVFGLTGVTVENAGEISGSITASASGFDNTDKFTNADSTTVDAMTMVTTEVTSSSSEFIDLDTGGSTVFTNAEDGVIDGNISAFANDDVTFENSGDIDGNANLNADATDRTSLNTNNSETVNDMMNMVITSETSATGESTTESTGGSVVATNNSGATIDGLLVANADTDSTVTNAGTITGDVFQNASGTTSSNNNSSSSTSETKTVMDDIKMTFTSSTSSTTNTGASAFENTGGTTSLTNADDATIEGGVDQFAHSDAIVTNAGTITGEVEQTASGTTSSSSNTSDTTSAMDDMKMTSTSLITNTGATASESTGGSTTLTNEEGATIEGGVNQFANSEAIISNDGTIDGFISVNAAGSVTATANTSVNKMSSDGMTNISTTYDVNSSESSRTDTGGSVTFTNSASGLTDNGNINLNADADITVDNAGSIRGSLSAFTNASDSSNMDANETHTTIDASDPMNTVTTRQFSDSSSSSFTSIGGDITGTYSGTNGTLNFTPAANGQISQNAQGDSTIAISGDVFGNVFSTAGSGNNSEASSMSETNSVMDTNGDGSNDFTSANSSASTNADGGASSVTVTGSVRQGNGGAGGSITSSGTDTSAVVIDGGVVSGNVFSGAENFTTENENSRSFSQTTAEFDTTTDQLDESESSSRVENSGAATISILNGAEIGGTVTVSGISSAALNVSADSEVSNVDVFATRGNDFSSSETRTFTRDAMTGDVTAFEEETTTSGTSAAAGDAQADIAGMVENNVDVFAQGGNATVDITGVVGNNVTANTFGFVTTNTTRNYFNGNAEDPASGSTFFPTLVNQDGVVNNKTVFTNSSEITGGAAAVTIDTASEFQEMGLDSVGGNVNAAGIAGATVDVLSGSTVAGQVSANSQFIDNATTQTTTRDADGRIDILREETSTRVGSASSATNDGVVEEGINVFGTTTATVNNNGVVGDPETGPGGFSATFVQASAIGTNVATTVVDLNTQNAALRDQTTTTVYTAIGGDATVNNSAGALIEGNVFANGANGTVNNDGLVFGSINVGFGVDNFTIVSNDTAGSSTQTITLPTTLFQQNYTVNQNNISGGINVTGATVREIDPDTGEFDDFQTSDINATINLNSGSITAGSIIAQRDDETDENLTTTIVNLNGSGFLGVDVVDVVPESADQFLATPRVTLGNDLLTEVGGFVSGVGSDGIVDFNNPIPNSSASVRLLGLTELNKEDAGTFVIVGQEFTPTSPSRLLPVWTVDAENINVNAGELQLTLDGNTGVSTGAGGLFPNPVNPPLFGISGDINNDANIVIGRRVDISQPVIGQNLISPGQQIIEGINVFQQGDYTQSASGTTTVGLNGTLTRFAPLGINVAEFGNSTLGPINGQAVIPFFTVAGGGNTGVAVGGFSGDSFGNVVASTSSHVEVDGDLNLAGTIDLVVAQDSLFLSGDGAEIFSYTGEGNVSATATPSIASNFVSFDVVHDTGAQTVSVIANRSSYSSAGTNVNAVSAATGFDSTFAEAVTGIRDDALGVASFNSVEEIGFAQDIANLGAALDFRLNETQAGELFDELSGGEIHGSVSAVNQSVLSNIPLQTLKTSLIGGDELGSRVYFNPFARHATLGGGEDFGASDVDVDSYGGNFGADFAYSPNGAFGFAFGYGQHEVEAVGTQETADLESFTAGVYAVQKFGNFYGTADFSYSFSDIETERVLDLTTRTITADYDAEQWDGGLEVGYAFELENGAVLSPYGRIAARNWDTEGFTEEGGGGVSLNVAEESNTIFNPSIGGRATADFDAGNFNLRPYVDLSYTFQGNVDADRSVDFVAGGDNFDLRGVDPDGFGTIDAGVNSTVSGIFSIFAGVKHSFSGDNEETTVRGGGSFKF